METGNKWKNPLVKLIQLKILMLEFLQIKKKFVLLFNKKIFKFYTILPAINL